MGAIVGFFTDYQHNKWLDQLLNNISYTPPTTIYAGLSTGLATKLFASSTEVGINNTTGYQRVLIPSGSFNTAALGTTNINRNLVFNTPSGNWGNIQSVFLFDASTGGNVLAVIGLPTSVIVNSGDSPRMIPSGSLLISRT